MQAPGELCELQSSFLCAAAKERLSSQDWWGGGRRVAPPSHRQVYGARGDNDHIAKENKAGYTKFAASFTPRLSYGEMTHHFRLYLWTL